MRFFRTLLSVTLLVTGVLAAKKSSEERFNDFHTKSLSSTPVKLTDVTYKSLTATPRDYSVTVLLTALDPRYGCELCQGFQPEWETLAKSWINGDKKAESRMLFGTLDFKDGRDTFLSLGLQTAPVLLHFRPTAGPHAEANTEPVRYDFTSGAQTADQVHAWLSRLTPDRPHPAVHRPINWMRIIVTTVLGLGVVTAIATSFHYIQPIIQNRNLWAAFTLIAIILFTSGHMFNHIRKVPYITQDKRGNIAYFAGGFQNQFGIETQIVAALYGVMAFCTIALAVKVPRMADPRTQQVAVLVWGGVLFGTYSFFMSVFRVKNAGYPFSLPPFM